MMGPEGRDPESTKSIRQYERDKDFDAIRKNIQKDDNVRHKKQK